MTDRTLRNCRVLVVEDEYMLAGDLVMELGDAGAIGIGPAGTVDDALAMIAAEPHIDGAILDVNLCGEMMLAVADRLAERDVPFILTTGHDPSVFPGLSSQAPRYEKPIGMARVIEAIGRVIHA